MDRRPFRKGERVYWRHRDLFGAVQADECDGRCDVKLELPWDPNAAAESALATDLQRSYEVE